MAEGQPELLDELARFEAEMRGLESAAPEPAPAPAQRLPPVAAAVSRAAATMGSAPVPAGAAGPPVMLPAPPPHHGHHGMPMPPLMPMPHPPPIHGYGGMPPMYGMPQMPPPPVFQQQYHQPGMDPAVLAHMRQQMGAAAAASATAMVHAQHAAVAKAAGGKLAQPVEVDVQKLHFREVGGEKWVDPSLSEWPENDFRIFVGNLGTEVNDDVITKAFSRYHSFNKAKIVRDKKTSKSKGYGFASFSEQAEMYKVLKEMEGKYIGNRPCKLKKSTWDKREVEATPDLVESAVKKLKSNPAGGSKTPKDRRKHVNLLHHK